MRITPSNESFLRRGFDQVPHFYSGSDDLLIGGRVSPAIGAFRPGGLEEDDDGDDEADQRQSDANAHDDLDFVVGRRYHRQRRLAKFSSERCTGAVAANPRSGVVV